MFTSTMSIHITTEFDTIRSGGPWRNSYQTFDGWIYTVDEIGEDFKIGLHDEGYPEESTPLSPQCNSGLDVHFVIHELYYLFVT